MRQTRSISDVEYKARVSPNALKERGTPTDKWGTYKIGSSGLVTLRIRRIINELAPVNSVPDYWAVKRIGLEVSKINNVASNALSKHQYGKAISVAFGVLDALVPALKFIDDSNAYIGDNIRMALSILTDAVKEDLPDDIMDFIFRECMTRYDKGIYKGWDWHEEILSVAIDAARTPQEFELIKAGIRRIRHGLGKPYDDGIKCELMSRLIARSDTEEIFLKYLKEHVVLPELRKELIKRLIDKKDYSGALQIAREGCEIYKNNNIMIPCWKELVLQILVLEKDVKNIITAAKELFLMPNFSSDHKKYYDILKEYVPVTEWNEFVDGLIEKLVPPDYDYFLYNLCKWENRKSVMLDVVRRYKDARSVREAEADLYGEYPAELADCYVYVLREQMKTNNNRKQYRAACFYIRHIIKLDYPEKAVKLVEEFRRTYPLRTALMEELDSCVKGTFASMHL